MFKFNFSSSQDDCCTISNEGSSPAVGDDLVWLQAERLIPNEKYTVEEDEDSVNTFYCGQFHIKYHKVDSIIPRALNTTSLDTSSIAIAEQNQSDLLPAKYEGGLKIWECTYDLSEYLLTEFTGKNLSGCRVLDLGCGAGLLGLLALKLQATVTFQDYNKDVLEALTIPNVLINLSAEERRKLLDSSIEPESKQCQFYFGDWETFAECLQENSGSSGGYFDYILTSETIYYPANHEKLCKVFTKCLKKTGTVFLAAKTYYFGVGGGTRQFEDVVSRDGDMLSDVCWKSEGGVQREILMLRFKDS